MTLHVLTNFLWSVSAVKHFDYPATMESTVMRISRVPSPLQKTIDQKQLENMKYFKYLYSVITNDARCGREIKSRIVTKKAEFNRKKTFH
jgi:hypothetical protein